MRYTRPSCTPRRTSWRNGSSRACCRRSTGAPRSSPCSTRPRGPSSVGRWATPPSRSRSPTRPSSTASHRSPSPPGGRGSAATSRHSTGRATVVGQHVEGLPGCGDNHWARLDIALNVAVVGLPITVLCPYRTDDPELARVEATHPRLVTATGMVPSGTYRPPVDALVEYPPPPPPELGPPAAELSFAADDLGDLRHLVAEVAARGGTAPERSRTSCWP